MEWRGVTKAVASSLLVMAFAAACGGDDTEQTPTATATAAASTSTPTMPQPTATPDPQAEVLAAYDKYWEVYGQALREHDASRLSEVMTGARLERAIIEVENLQRQGQVVAVVVQSSPVVVTIDGDHALLIDDYHNQSHLIDPDTGRPLQPTPVPGPTLRDQVTLQLVGGTWKVSESVREVSE